MPRILDDSPASIDQAVARLRAGDIVAFPTETVYGLGGGTFDANAIGRIYVSKGRPAGNPLIAHVLDAAQARTVTALWDDRCAKLAERFWPGPLTLVLPRAESVPLRATAGLPTVAVRSPAHPVARAIIKGYGAPVSAPSANRTGNVSPTRAEHVAEEFADLPDLLIIDGGPSALGIESTVVDLTRRRPRLLRPGSVTAEALRETLGDIDTAVIASQDASPGTAAAHYMPSTPTRLLAADDLVSALDGSNQAVLAISGVPSAPGRRVIHMPDEGTAYAARLYGALREADHAGMDVILIERPSAVGGVWDAVHDRLRRATS